VALNDLQRAGITGILVLAGLGAAGVIGSNAIKSYEQSKRAEIHYIPGSNIEAPDRRECLNEALKTMTKFNRQAIYNANVDCELQIQSLEGHIEMTKRGDAPPAAAGTASR